MPTPDLTRTTDMPSPTDRFFIVDYETTGITYEDVPIEIGYVITDDSWEELESYDHLIYSDEANECSNVHWEDAQRLHGISRDEVFCDGLAAEEVADMIESTALAYKPGGGRLILMSDNIQFEWRHTDWILQHIGLRCADLFHYCGWDTSVLSLFTNFKDPENTEHRALSDVRGLVKELRRVSEAVRHAP